MMQAMTDQTPMPPETTPPRGAPPVGPPLPAPPDPDAPRALRRRVVAWLALVLFCLVVVSSDAIVAALPGPTPPPKDAAEIASFQVEVVGKFSVGAKDVLGAAMGTQIQDNQLADIAKPLDEIAQIADARERDIQYVDRFRAIILLAELAGAEAGVEQLDALLEAPGVPESLLEDGRLVRRIYEHGPDTLTTDEQDRLIDRHAWIGRLAVSFDQPPNSPDRAIVLREARFSFYGLMGLAGLALGALPIGFALFMVGAILLGTGKIRPRYQPDRAPGDLRNTAFLEVVSLFMGALALFKIIGALLDRVDPDKAWVGIAGLALYAAQWGLLLLVFWPLVRGVGMRQLVRGLGWTPGRGLFRELGAGIVGYLAGIPLLLVGFLMMFGLMWLTKIEPSHPIVERAGQHDILNILFIYSIAVIWAPLVEESIFRGAFYHHLRRWLGPVLSALIVAFVFAGVHPQGFVAMPPLMALAFVFAMIREWRGSVFGCMAAHALHNGILMTVNIFFLAVLR